MHTHQEPLTIRDLPSKQLEQLSTLLQDEITSRKQVQLARIKSIIHDATKPGAIPVDAIMQHVADQILASNGVQDSSNASRSPAETKTV